ncbi:MAG: TRAP transporter substrate-binding protein [Burkholderiaceae bacterium]|jgi:TRAP-type C4-dicarboxylate transport system substrate-binding protein
MKKLLPALAASALMAAGGASAQTVFTVSSWVPPTHGLSTAQKEWCDILEKNSNGRMKCNILPRAPVGPAGTLDAVKNGVLDISFTVQGYTPGRFALTKMAEFPFLGESAEATSVAYQRIAQKYPEFTAEHVKQGIKPLAFFTHGPGIVFNTKRPITRADDLTRLKFRIGGGFINDITKQLNMNVTLKPAPDSYELLSTGVMDGTLFPAESLDSFKIDKVVKHATTFPGGLYNTSFVFMMNPAKYDRLSADDKKVIDAISGEFVARMFGKSWDRVDRIATENMKKNNVAITKADPAFVSEVTVVINKLERDWAAEAAKGGLKNAASVLAEFRSEAAKLK